MPRSLLGTESTPAESSGVQMLAAEPLPSVDCIMTRY